MNGFINNNPCKACGGKCCKGMGCHLSPEDIKTQITYETLKELLQTGNYSIDWWENYEVEGKYPVNGYYLRMRNKDAKIVDPSWGGECALLTEHGCPLKFEERPKGGRMLEAKENSKCVQHYSKKECADDWFKYYVILNQLVTDYYEGKIAV